MDGLLVGLAAAVVVSVFAFLSLRSSEPKVIPVYDNLHDNAPLANATA